ncbi:MAG: hypothetical protein FWG84_05415 [Bacteroidales bacterium]|nr:hypothetical protein [Bacteroidales bacterium]
MKKRIVIAATFALSFLTPTMVFGQYAEQALRLSYLSYGGTARFTGMGGAFGAVGGDFTSLSINPAGIGVYTKSEVTFTPLIYNTRSFSEYFNNNQEEFRVRMNVNNAGWVFAIPMGKNNDIKYIQFGIGYNRLANYNNSIYFEGFNDRNSFVRALSDDATNANWHNDFYPQNPLYADELADAVNLLIYDQSVDRFRPDKESHVAQSALLRREGGIDELVFTMGGNYSDMLYFGATLGIPFMSYWQSYQYEEWDPYGNQNFRGMSYEEDYRSDGAGINAKFGAIFKPIPSLRIGAAIHTPTYYWIIQETEWMRMSSFFKDDTTKWSGTKFTPERVFEYSQATPMRAIGSLAFVAGKIAIISADYEWVDHSMNTLQPSRESAMRDANTEIRNYYTNQHIVRAGAELHWNNLYLRGGYGWYSSPFKNKDVNDMSLNTWSVGAGIRAGAFGLDFAYQNARSKSKYYPYDADRYGWYNNDPSPYAKLTNNANSYMLTFSFRY